MSDNASVVSRGESENFLVEVTLRDQRSPLVCWKITDSLVVSEREAFGGVRDFESDNLRGGTSFVI